jgi:hypothetical protein
MPSANYKEVGVQEEARPATDLESLLDLTRGSAKYAQEIAAVTADIVIKLRGNLPPSGEGQSNLAKIPAPPSGILGELREAQSEVHRLHSGIFELLGMIRTAI